MAFLVGDLYGPQAQRSSPAASAPANLSASGSFSQTGSASVSASGMPAAWFLGVVAAALLLLHWGGGGE